MAVPLYFGGTSQLEGTVGRAWGSIVLQLSGIDGGDATGFLDDQETTTMVVTGMASEPSIIDQPDFVGRDGIVPGGVGGGRSSDVAFVSGELADATVWLLCGGESVFTGEDH